METGNVSLNEERKRVCKRLLLDHHVVVGSKWMLYFVLLHICEFYSEEKKIHFIANFFSLTVQRRNNWESLLHLLCDFYVHRQKGSRKWQPWSRVRNSQISSQEFIKISLIIICLQIGICSNALMVSSFLQLFPSFGRQNC